MNNKGQAFILFILLLPIILIAFSFIIDIGLLNYSKKTVDMKIEKIIENSLSNNLTENEIHELLIKNINNIEEKNIIKEENSLEISLTIKINPIFDNILKQDRYEIKYLGKKIEEKINIIRK